jgi:hypothetical protein
MMDLRKPRSVLRGPRIPEVEAPEFFSFVETGSDISSAGVSSRGLSVSSNSSFSLAADGAGSATCGGPSTFSCVTADDFPKVSADSETEKISLAPRYERDRAAASRSTMIWKKKEVI